MLPWHATQNSFFSSRSLKSPESEICLPVLGAASSQSSILTRCPSCSVQPSAALRLTQGLGLQQSVLMVSPRRVSEKKFAHFYFYVDDIVSIYCVQLSCIVMPGTYSTYPEYPYRRVTQQWMRPLVSEERGRETGVLGPADSTHSLLPP